MFFSILYPAPQKRNYPLLQTICHAILLIIAKKRLLSDGTLNNFIEKKNKLLELENVNVELGEVKETIFVLPCLFGYN